MYYNTFTLALVAVFLGTGVPISVWAMNPPPFTEETAELDRHIHRYEIGRLNLQEKPSGEVMIMENPSGSITLYGFKYHPESSYFKEIQNTFGNSTDEAEQRIASFIFDTMPGKKYELEPLERGADKRYEFHPQSITAVLKKPLEHLEYLTFEAPMPGTTSLKHFQFGACVPGPTVDDQKMAVLVEPQGGNLILTIRNPMLTYSTNESWWNFERLLMKDIQVKIRKNKFCFISKDDKLYFRLYNKTNIEFLNTNLAFAAFPKLIGQFSILVNAPYEEILNKFSNLKNAPYKALLAAFNASLAEAAPESFLTKVANILKNPEMEKWGQITEKDRELLLQNELVRDHITLGSMSPFKAEPQMRFILRNCDPIHQNQTSLEGILSPLNNQLQSAKIKARVVYEPLLNGLIKEKLTPDQKAIYRHFPKTKVAEDHVVHGYGYNENMFKLHITSLRNERRVSDVILWRGDRTSQEKFAQPGITPAIATTTIVSILETIRKADVKILATTGCLPVIVKELEIPVLETAKPLRPTRVFRINRNFGPELSQSNLSRSEYPWELKSVPLSESIEPQDGEVYTLDFLQ